MQVFIIAAVVVMYGLGEFKPLMPGSQQIFLTLALVGLQIVLAGVLVLLARRWALARLAASDNQQTRLPLIFRQLAFGLHVALLLFFAVDIYLVGWADLAIWATRSLPILADELLILLPVLVSWAVLHLLWYDLDRAIRQHAQQGRKSSGRIWSRGRYLLFHLQLGLAPALIPLCLLMGLIDSLNLLDGHLPSGNVGRFLFVSTLVLGAGLIFLFTPVLIRWAWACRPLTDAPLQAKLEELCQGASLRYRQILVWPTSNMVANAAVMGFWGPLRYLMVTDALLAEMSQEQITAVFAHEIAHVTGRHLPYYGLFLIGVNLLIFDCLELLYRFLPILEREALSIGLQIVLLAGAFLGVFGWISRRFERDADVLAAQRRGCPDGHCQPGCPAYDLRRAQQGQTPHGPPSDRLCPLSAGCFSDALGRIALLNAIPQQARSWRHSSISSRRELLQRLSAQPGRLLCFRRNIRLIKLAIWISVLIGICGALLLNR